jgi:hypothetical protein
MPAKTVEKLKQKTARLKKKVAEKGAAMSGTDLRAAKKSIRRAQRQRRSLEARAKRLAGPAEAPAAS